MSIINNIKSVFQTTDKIIWMDLNKIIIDPEIEGIFIQKESEISNICENMKENGFDPAHPIILAISKEHPELNNTNADGHTRYKAAIRAGLTKIAIIYKDFSDREDLLKFVYEQQLLRRNLNQNEIFNAWAALNRLTNEDGKKAKSDSEIASELHISRRTVAKMKEVTKKATPEVIEKIESGKLSLNKVYTEIKQEESKSSENEETNLKEYNEAFYEGAVMAREYFFKSLEHGKTIQDLQREAIALKNKTMTVYDMVKSLKIMKELDEQKQTE